MPYLQNTAWLVETKRDLIKKIGVLALSPLDCNNSKHWTFLVKMKVTRQTLHLFSILKGFFSRNKIESPIHRIDKCLIAEGPIVWLGMCVAAPKSVCLTEKLLLGGEGLLVWCSGQSYKRGKTTHIQNVLGNRPKWRSTIINMYLPLCGSSDCINNLHNPVQSWICSNGHISTTKVIVNGAHQSNNV